MIEIRPKQSVDFACGTKAVALGRLEQLGIGVPRFTCIDTTVFDSVRQLLQLPDLISFYGASEYDQRYSERFDNVAPSSLLCVAHDTGPSLVRSSAVPSTRSDMRSFSSVVSGAYTSVPSDIHTDTTNAVWSAWRAAYERRPYDQLTALRAADWIDGLGLVVQDLIRPELSGVAHVRRGEATISWVEGHLSRIVDGSAEGVEVSLEVGPRAETLICGTDTSVQTTVEQVPCQYIEELHRVLLEVADEWGEDVEVEWAVGETGLVLLQAQPLLAR